MVAQQVLEAAAHWEHVPHYPLYFHGAINHAAHAHWENMSKSPNSGQNKKQARCKKEERILDRILQACSTHITQSAPEVVQPADKHDFGLTRYAAFWLDGGAEA